VEVAVVVKAGRVFLNMVQVVSGVPQASFWSAAVGQFAGVGILEVELVASHTAALFSFLWQKRKQGSWKAKQVQIGGREVQLRTTRPVQPFGGTAAGRNMTMYVVK